MACKGQDPTDIVGLLHQHNHWLGAAYRTMHFMQLLDHILMPQDSGQSLATISSMGGLSEPSPQSDIGNEMSVGKGPSGQQKYVFAPIFVYQLWQFRPAPALPAPGTGGNVPGRGSAVLRRVT